MRNAKAVGAIVVLVGLALGSRAARCGGAEARLDYRQEQSLKDAAFYLNQAEGIAKGLETKTAAMKVGDTSLQLTAVQGEQSDLAQATKVTGYAENRLKLLPAEHSKVKPQLERMAAIKASLATSGKKLDEVEAGLKGVVAQGMGEGFKVDFDRLQEISRMFADPAILEDQPERATKVAAQMAAVKEERKRIADKYADLLKQDTPQSTNMKNVLTHFDDVFGQFDRAAKSFVEGAPARIEQGITDTLKMAIDAVQNKKHLFFRDGGGVNHGLLVAQARQSVYAALAPDAAAASQKKIDAAREQVKQMKASLNDAIFAANLPPDDQYSGPDKAQLIELVKAKWADAKVNGAVLKTGINSQSWQRSTRWEYVGNRTWSKVDTSFIQGFVIVKADDGATAHVHYVNLVKDHMAEDKIFASNFEDPKTPPDVNRKLLVKNVK